MSMLRRRMMMQKSGKEIPRTRLIFSNAGDVICTDCTKTNDGDAICGLAVIHQTRQPQYNPYWIYLIMLARRVDFPDWNSTNNAVVAKWTQNSNISYNAADGYVYRISGTYGLAPNYVTYAEAIEFIRQPSININNLPILDDITGKRYEDDAGVYVGRLYYSTESSQDLLDYYCGVIY